MNRSMMGALAMGTLAGFSSAAEVSPADFAFGMPVVTPADASAYRVALPVDVYRDTVRPDLADIRVFNARGEAVPYVLSRPSARAARGPGTALPLFALRDDSPAAAGRSAPFELTSVVAEPADSRIEAERSTLEVAGSASGVARGEYQFDLGARLPIERINLGLPEINTVIAVDLLSRGQPRDAWRRVAVTVLRATLGARRQLGGQARLAMPAEFPWKRVLLWTVLALSVCLLAWMAYRVTREMGENAPR